LDKNVTGDKNLSNGDQEKDSATKNKVAYIVIRLGRISKPYD